jgi:hypothetical protein
MQISQTEKQIQALRSVQDNCEIQGISLLSCNVTKAKAGTSFREPSLSNISPSLRGSSLAVEVSFEYSAWDSSEPAERLFVVNATFEAVYQLREAYLPTDEESSSFSRGTAVFNCWPYAREFLRDITSRMGHQTPVLPLLRIVPRKTDPGQQTIETAAATAALPESESEAEAEDE